MLSRKKLLNSGLLLVAALVWGWNARLLTRMPAEKAGNMTDIPEIPQSWDRLFSSKLLPEMGFDPFNPFGKISLEDVKTPNTRSISENLPRGTFILTLERKGFYEAVFKDSQGKTRNIIEKNRIGRWVVEKIELDRIQIKHQTTGKIHEYALP